MSSPGGPAFLKTMQAAPGDPAIRPSILKNGSTLALRQQKSDNTGFQHPQKVAEIVGQHQYE